MTIVLVLGDRKSRHVKLEFKPQELGALWPNAYETQEQTFRRLCPVTLHRWKGYWSLYVFNIFIVSRSS